MAIDAKTREAYERDAARYADMTNEEAEAVRAHLEEVAAAMPPGGRVLDLGCGPAWAAAWFAARGFEIHAIDASPALAAEALSRYGIEVEIADIAQLDVAGAYDGIWASFSLLHLDRSAMPIMLGRLARALRPGGMLYLGMKEGQGDERDDLGRYYSYFGEQELLELLRGTGFSARTAERRVATGLAGVDSTGLHILARRNA